MIYSNNTNTINIVNSLRATTPYNQLLIWAMNIVLDHNLEFQVLHVQSADNSIADAVSWFKNDLAVSLCPGLVIQTFQPPQDVLGVEYK